ncbi:hypothetical protein D3C72_2013900 [compost metagenome]
MVIEIILNCFLNSCLFEILSPKKNIKVIYVYIPIIGSVDFNILIVSFVVTGIKFSTFILGNAAKKVKHKNAIKIIITNSIYLAKYLNSLLVA